MQQNIFNFIRPDNKAILNTVATIVGSTLGPNGKSVIIGNGNKTYTTKDGVSVLRFINSNDIYIQNVINTIRESAENTLKEAGDGTTSTILIANALLSLLKSEKADKNIVKYKISSMISKLPTISQKLDEKKAKELIKTAIGNENELLETLYEAYIESEKYGVPITVETVNGTGNKVEVVNGIYFNATIISDIFKGKNIYIDNPHVICYAGNIESEKEVIKAIDKCLDLGIKDVVIIANGYSEEALAIMSINQLRNTINMIPMIVSGAEMHNNDIINILAKALDCEIGGESFSTRMYDSFSKVYNKTKVFRYENNKAIFENIEATNDVSKEIIKIEEELRKAPDDDKMNQAMFMISLLKRKIIKAVISSSLKNKMNELKDRADDAIHSLLTAKEFGVVKGAGQAYVELNLVTKHSLIFEETFACINKTLGDIKGGLDSAKTIEAVLKSASELALLLDSVDYVLSVQKN